MIICGMATAAVNVLKWAGPSNASGLANDYLRHGKSGGELFGTGGLG
jgi:hypothetical protein